MQEHNTYCSSAISSLESELSTTFRARGPAQDAQARRASETATHHQFPETNEDHLPIAQRQLFNPPRTFLRLYLVDVDDVSRQLGEYCCPCTLELEDAAYIDLWAAFWNVSGSRCTSSRRTMWRGTLRGVTASTGGRAGGVEQGGVEQGGCCTLMT